ncbi:MAG: hypothetical protein PF690_11480 [Deltaproteobacteria bacterium]|jgi:hypothetical protein|nr:hypothetical protein [Deltaproteobacteria bacterium]
MTFSSRFDWTFNSKLLAGLLIFFLYAFLISPDHCPADNSGIYRQPDKTDDGWETGTLNSVFENPEMIIKLLFKIRNGDYLNIHGVILVKGGKLILEKYYHGFDRNKFHEIRSSTKSIGSILTGLAIDHGYLSGEQEKVYWIRMLVHTKGAI